MGNLPPQRRLTTACEDGDYETAVQAVKEGAKVNFYDSRDSRPTPLYNACYWSGRGDSVKLVRWLLEQGADPRIVKRSSPEKTILETAVAHASKFDTTDPEENAGLEICRILINEAKVPLMRSQETDEKRAKEWHYDFPALIMAVRSGNLAAAKLLIEGTSHLHLEKMHPMGLKDKTWSTTPFQIAIEQDHAHIVEWVVKNDPSFLNSSKKLCTSFKYSPLAFAIKEKKLKVAKALIRCGASFTYRSGRDNTGVSAFDTALKEGQFELVQFMLGKHFQREKKFKESGEVEEDEEIKPDVEDDEDDEKKGNANNNDEQKKKEESEHEQNNSNKKKQYKPLIDFLGTRDKAVPAIIHAIENGNFPYFLTILAETEKQIALEQERHREEEAEERRKWEEEQKKKGLLQRAKEGVTDAIKEKLENEINKNSEGFSVSFEKSGRMKTKPPLTLLTLESYNRNLLATACEHGQVEICRFLIDERGFDANHSDTWGNTPLFQAAEKGHYDVVNLLLARGADVTHIKTKFKKTNPIHQACEGGNLKTVFLIYDELEKKILEQQNGDVAATQKILLELVNSTEGSFDRTPLLLCLRNWREKAQRKTIANFLLHVGADPLIADTFSRDEANRTNAIQYCEKDKDSLAAELMILQNHKPGQKYEVFEKRAKVSVVPVPLFSEVLKKNPQNFSAVPVRDIDEVEREEKERAEREEKQKLQQEKERREKIKAEKAAAAASKKQNGGGGDSSMMFWITGVVGTVVLGYFLNTMVKPAVATSASV